MGRGGWVVQIGMGVKFTCCADDRGECVGVTLWVCDARGIEWRRGIKLSSSYADASGNEWMAGAAPGEDMGDTSAAVLGSSPGADGSICLYLLLTGTFAASFGLSALTLASLGVSPTTLAFVNMIYKLLTTVFGHFMFPSNVPPLSWVGYSLAFFGFIIYISGKQGEGRKRGKGDASAVKKKRQ